MQPTDNMTSPPTESQKRADEVPKKSTSATKHREELAAASANSDAADTSKEKNTSKDNADGKMDGISPAPANKTAKENSTTAPKESPNTKTTKNPKPSKIKVHLVAVGSAPILKKSKFLMNADDRFAVAISFLRKVLKLSSATSTGAASASSLFLYINAAFVPSPDERMGDLFDCFGTRGELVVHYSLQEAWG
mmetsp:Transcript_25269/g.45479  ORF Transcript_25269/g.45479 Transcript_25269/m.45479 type:complete len:193 (-) Transcript_25269:226-804(-)